MLFQKKTVHRNIKVKLRTLEPEGPRSPISGRLALGLAAPFVVVAVFLWVFSKQAIPPSTAKKTQEGTIPSETVSKDVAPKTESVPEAVAVPVKDVTEKEPPQKKEPKPVERLPQQTPQKTVSKKTVDALDIQTKKEAPIKETAGRKTSKETPLPAKVIPQVKQVKIVEGRPRSPLEKKQTSNNTESKPVEDTPKKTVKTPPTTKEIKEDKKPVPAQRVAKLPPPLDAQNSPADSPSSLKPAETQKSSGRFYKLQVGAFQKKEDAEKFAFRLKEHGHEVSIAIANIPDKGMWHRVRVGHYADKALAEKEGEKFSRTEQLPFFITSDP